MIVVDASAAISALMHAGAARDVLGADSLHAPHLLDVEVASGLRRLHAAGEIDAASGSFALLTLQRLALERYPMRGLLQRIWDLRGGVSSYDAAYVALAEALGCPLLTADARLSRAPGVRCPVTVVPRA